MAVTANYGFTKPTVAGDAGVWGGFLNTDLDSIDLVLAVPKINWTSPTVGATTTCDLSISRIFAFTVSQATTLAFSNPPTAAFDAKVALLITNGSAFVLTFPASVTWLSGVAPTLKAAGVDIVDLETKDAGVTWLATLRNQRPGVLFNDFNKSTVSVGEVSITSYSLPANALGINGQKLRITAHGKAVTSGGVFKIKFGAATVINISPGANNEFCAIGHLVRQSNTLQSWSDLTILAAAASANSVGDPTETLSGAVTIDFRGSASAGQLLLRSVTVEFLAVA